MPVTLPAFPNLLQPAPGYLSAGQPTAAQLEEGAAAGLSSILDFRAANEDHGFDEAAKAASLGIVYHNLPISEPTDLTRAQAQKLDALLAESPPGLMLLHCGSGNRVGALIALRAGWILGQSPAEALQTGRAWGLTKLEPYIHQLLEQQA